MRVGLNTSFFLKSQRTIINGILFACVLLLLLVFSLNYGIYMLSPWVTLLEFHDNDGILISHRFHRGILDSTFFRITLGDEVSAINLSGDVGYKVDEYVDSRTFTKYPDNYIKNTKTPLIYLTTKNSMLIGFQKSIDAGNEVLDINLRLDRLPLYQGITNSQYDLPMMVKVAWDTSDMKIWHTSLSGDDNSGARTLAILVPKRMPSLSPMSLFGARFQLEAEDPASVVRKSSEGICVERSDLFSGSQLTDTFVIRVPVDNSRWTVKLKLLLVGTSDQEPTSGSGDCGGPRSLGGGTDRSISTHQPLETVVVLFRDPKWPRE
jgi:hypothetical protein